MATHFVYSGFGIRQLCDLVLFVEANLNSIDWKLVYDKAKKCKAEKFSMAIFEVCRRFFKISVPEIFQNNDLIDNKYIDMIEDSILSKGTFEGNYGKISFEFGKVSEDMLFYSEKSGDSRSLLEKVMNFIVFLFPSLEKMKQRYSYLNKCSIFLPIAWVHRILYGITRRDISLDEKSNLLLSDSNILTERAKLFKWLDL